MSFSRTGRIVFLLISFVLLAVSLTLIIHKKVIDRVLWSQYSVVYMTIEGKSYRLIEAVKPEQWQQGLMNITKPVFFDGMVFRFSYPATQEFWNKNTLVNLKIFWINQGKVVGTSDLPSVTSTGKIITVASPGKVDTVVELIK